MQESMYHTKANPTARETIGASRAGFCLRPETSTEIPMPLGEITAALKNLDNLQCELTARLESLCVKLGPILREPYPQEQCDNEVAGLPQTKVGREIQENCNRLELTIRIIKDITDRICL